MSTKEIEEEGVFAIYPNPANAFITFQLPEIERLYEITILDNTGRVVRKQLLNGGKQTMPIMDLANGAYLVEIMSAEDRMTTPIAVIHRY